MRKNVYKGRIKKKFGKFFHTHLLEVLGHGGGSVRGCSGSRVLTSMLAAPLYNVPTTTNNPNTLLPHIRTQWSCLVEKEKWNRMNISSNIFTITISCLKEAGIARTFLTSITIQHSFQFPVSRMRMCLVWARVCLHTRADVIYFAGKFEAWKLRAIPSSVASRHAARFATRKVRVVSCMERSVIYHLQYSLLHFNFIQKENFECVQSTRTHISVVCRWWIW